MRPILVLDRDVEARTALLTLLAEEGGDVAAVRDPEEALAELHRGRRQLLFCALDDAERLLPRLSREPEAPLVVVTVASHQRRQGAAVVAGGAAVDCLTLPADREEIALTLCRVERFEARQRGADANPASESAPRAAAERPVRPPVGDMVGESQGMCAVYETIEKVARHKAAVLITGESGTGKELVARAIHDLGPRQKGPFIAVNCGAIPANLLESELFGYRRGAFTDAVKDKAGLFEAACGGTLFLDEIGELPLNLQVKLLRTLQEEEIRRLGDNRPTKIDVRIIAATLRNLADDVAQGRFREDLYYRLNVLPLALPPLRERRADIRLLAEHFVALYRGRHRGPRAPAERISDEAMALLERYDWPGNIRELENTIERAMVLADGPIIEAHLLDDRLRAPRADGRVSVGGDSAQVPAGGEGPANSSPANPFGDLTGDLSIKKNTRRMEELLIRSALERVQGNRHKAAKLLGISYRALLYKIKEYGILHN